MIRILGIDPGSQITGLGVIESDGRNSHYICHASIKLDKLNLPEKLADIHRQVSDIILQWQPREAAVEEVFMSRNAASALKLGQARGVAIAACMVNRVPVYEYAARTVKQAVVGTGAAAKQQVQHMTRTLLSIRGRLPEDAADALAIALCHAHNRMHRYNEIISSRRSTRRRY